MPRWPDDHDTIEAATPSELRRWLEVHHADTDAVWFRYWKKGSNRPSLTWSEVVDELLCFGWIDAKVQSIDDNCYVQYLTRRKAGSVWSRINQEKVARLTAEGRMTEAGTVAVQRARDDGSWNALDPVEDLVVPDDLAAALDARPGARDRAPAVSRLEPGVPLGENAAMTGAALCATLASTARSSPP